MTKRSLMQSVDGSPELIVAGLRDRVLTPLLQIGSASVRAVDEPVFRVDDIGGMYQSIRVDLTEAGGTTRARILAPGKVEVDAVANEAGLPNLVRLFVPEVAAPQPFVVELTVGGQTHQADITVNPQRKWTIHLIHHNHLDVGYTDPQGMVLSHHLDYLDSVLDLTDATDSWPDDARFRWSIEAVWPFVKWLEQRPTAQVARMIDRIRSGRVELTAMPFNLHTEAASTDELHEQLRAARDLSREHGFDVTTVMQSDVPGAAVGFVDALTDVGVRYLSAAHNWAGRSVPHLVGGAGLPRLFRWCAPSGGSLLVWLADSPHGMAYMEGNLLGLGENFAAAADLLPTYLAALASKPYPYGPEMFGLGHLDMDELDRDPYPHNLLHLRVQGQFGDNASPNLAVSQIAREWNETFAYPRLRVSTNTEFFTEAEHRYGDELETFSGDWTDWWADGIGSAARPLGYARRAQASLPVAATLHVIADLNDAPSDEDVVAATREAYLTLGLWDEHTWGAGNPWNDTEDGFDSGGIQWLHKADFAHRAYDDTRELLEGGIRRLASTIPTARDALASIVVWNTFAHSRDDLVRVFIPASRIPLNEVVSVVDPDTGATVTHDEDAQSHLIHRPIGRWITFHATRVPGCGYRRYDVLIGAGPEPVQQLDEPMIENEFYRVTYHLKDARITSLFDKQAGRELINPDALVGFNQYLYDRYTSAPTFNHLSSRVFADKNMQWLGSRSTGHHGTIVERVRTGTEDRLIVELVGDGAASIQTTIRLPHGVRRVDITNRVQKIGTTAKEGGFFSFPFDVRDASPIFEVTGGVAGPSRPSVPGSAKHMRAIRHWAALGDAELSVGWATLEAPLVQLGDVHLPYAPFPGSLPLDRPEPATLHSWIFNNADRKSVV